MQARTESQVRRKAISAAQEALVEKAAKSPEKVLKTMREYPHFVADMSLSTLEAVAQVLLEKGYRVELLEFCDSARLERWVRKSLVDQVLFD